ncbi:transglutaminase-like domain-containing protein [Planctomonas deserti]|uniref:transglutaminase-like domain-containing protein n=1 Tax=Planctomonas deserti TaxID=2144185 RepID=UPI000D38ED20|nr:transglutaminase-like domain-containing protein [Planctomonas deserti]
MAATQAAGTARPIRPERTGRASRALSASRATATGNLIAVLLLQLLSAYSLWPIYKTHRFAVLVLVTVFAGWVIAGLGARLRWQSFTVFAAGLAAFLLLGVPIAVPGQALFGLLPTLDGLEQLLLGAGLGWKQLLTISLPVGDYQTLLVPAFILVLVTTIIGVTVAVRTRVGELAVFAPAALLVAGIVLGPNTARFPVELGLAFLVGALLWFAWLRAARRSLAIRLLNSQSGMPIEAPERSLLTAGRVVGTVATIAVAVVVAEGATTLVPPRGDRDVLRAAVEQPFDPREYTSPLAGFREYFQPAMASAELMTVSGLPAGAGLRLATMDAYNGVVYSVGTPDLSSASGSFTRVPYELDQAEVRGRVATIDVTVGEYEDVWLPSVGQLERITFHGPRAGTLGDSFFYNDNTGAGAVVSGLQQGDSYSLQAVVPPSRADGELARADPGPAEVPALPQLPEEVATALAGMVGTDRDPGRRLVAMLTALRERGYVSHSVGPDEPFSRSGHAVDRIVQLLTDDPMVGDAEQYAVAAAVLANEIGFPARVVLGFRADDGRAGADRTTVTGADLTAWIEVNTAEDGWVGVDPNPEVREIPEAAPEDPTFVSRPQSVVPPPAEERTEPDKQTPPDTSDEEPDGQDPVLAILFAVLRVLGWTLLAAALIASPFLAILGAKLRRRRQRRRRGTPLDRIRGGWAEFADIALDHGYDLPESGTRREIASAVGSPASRRLAAAADLAVFSPGEADEGQAGEVWSTVRELRGAMGSTLTRWQRFKAAVSLRSLGRGAGADRGRTR